MHGLPSLSETVNHRKFQGRVGDRVFLIQRISLMGAVPIFYHRTHQRTSEKTEQPFISQSAMERFIKPAWYYAAKSLGRQFQYDSILFVSEKRCQWVLYLVTAVWGNLLHSVHSSKQAIHRTASESSPSEARVGEILKGGTPEFQGKFFFPIGCDTYAGVL